MAARPVMCLGSEEAAALVMPLPSQRDGVVLRADLIELAMKERRVWRLADVACTIMSLASRSSLVVGCTERSARRSNFPAPAKFKREVPLRVRDLSVCDDGRLAMAELARVMARFAPAAPPKLVSRLGEPPLMVSVL